MGSKLKKIAKVKIMFNDKGSFHNLSLNINSLENERNEDFVARSYDIISEIYGDFYSFHIDEIEWGWDEY